MKPVTITIEQNEDGTIITDIYDDIDADLGYTAANIVGLMIRIGFEDEECVELMRRKLSEELNMRNATLPVDESLKSVH